MNITLRQLAAFAAVASTGSVTQAADQLCISQPAASMSLAELEKQLNGKLFDRMGNKLVLNDRGRLLWPKAIEALARVREIESLFADDGLDNQGLLKLSSSSTIGNYLLPQLMGRFVSHYPNVHLSLDVGNTEQVIDAIANFQADIGFIEGVCHHPQVHAEIWLPDRLAIFTAPSHPLAKKDNVSVDDLANARWILRELGSGTRNVFERAVQNTLTNLNVYLEIGHSEAIKRAVAAGLGISCLSILVVEDAIKRGELVEIPVPFLELQRPLYLLWHKEKYQSDLFKSFSSFSLTAN
ncbi:MAG TPA: LysR family transcriptional regulator [Pseudomonadales bacterium]|nr:LysR family transcriptional regulator [Pseudomonadales bacterium]